MVINKRFW